MEENLALPLMNSNSRFVEGDNVVFINPNKSDCLMKVYKVQGAGVLLDGNRSLSLSHLLRPATFAEVLAKHRISLAEKHFLEFPNRKYLC